MPVAKGPKGVAQEMRKFKEGKLHSGSKKGPVVTDRKQAIAIALNEAGMSKKKEMAKGGCPSCGKTGRCSCGGKVERYSSGGMVKGYASGGVVKGTVKGMGSASKGGKFKVC